MKAALFFLFYFLCAAFLAALIAYPVFQLANTNTFEFERWVTRFALILLVIGIIPTLRYFQLSNYLIGHNTPFKTFIRQSSIGFLLGLCILSVVIALLFILDIRTLSESDSLTVNLVLKAFAAGLLVALIEETLFRGLFFTLSKKWHSPLAAIIISSFFYASLHFIKPIKSIDSSSLNWMSGIEVMLDAFSAFFALNPSDFFALFSVGVLLGLVRFKTNSLSYCIGLHASWVFLIKICKELSDKNPQSEWSFLTGQYDGIIGLLSLAWLSILIIIYAWKNRNPNNSYI